MKDGQGGLRQGKWVVMGLAESCFGSWRGGTGDNFFLSVKPVEVLLKKNNKNMHYILQQARTHRDFFCTQK
jgi:hypothetical protein